MIDLDIRALAAGYRAGATLAELARRYGVAPATVRARLLLAGVVIRKPGARIRGVEVESHR